MSERRHTSGPWVSHDVTDPDDKDCGCWVVDIPDDGEATVTRLFFGDMEECTGRDLRNANLVAAAPDLLGACRGALTAIENLIPPDWPETTPMCLNWTVPLEQRGACGLCTLCQLRAAIAKAEGR